MSADREKLRQERKLRLIQGEEEGQAIDLLPDNVYGFAYAPGTDGMPLWARQTFQAFEIHKLSGDTIHFLGYMTAEEAKALDTAHDAIDVSLYPEPYEAAQTLVVVPRERVMKMRPVSRERGNWLPMTVLAKL